MDGYYWRLRARTEEKGGPGSGHWGHAGRPGQVGGSLPRDVAVSVATGRDWRERQERARRYGRFTSAATSGSVEEQSHLGGGVCASLLVRYQDDGHGVWKALYGAYGAHDGNSEVAAYRVSELLGLDIVPPTVFTNGGSSQMFIYDSEVGKNINMDHGNDAYDERALARTLSLEYPGMDAQIERMVLLDYIIGNTDRHPGNIVVGPDGKLWAIDHGHSVWKHTQRDATMWSWLKKGRMDLSPDLLERVRGLTKERFMGAMEGVDTSGNVDLEAAWERITWIQRDGDLG